MYTQLPLDVADCAASYTRWWAGAGCRRGTGGAPARLPPTTAVAVAAAASKGVASSALPSAADAAAAAAAAAEPGVLRCVRRRCCAAGTCSVTSVVPAGAKTAGSSIVKAMAWQARGDSKDGRIHPCIHEATTINMPQKPHV